MSALQVIVVPNLPFIEFSRDFDALVSAVYRAHADLDLVQQWLGPTGYTTEIDHWHLRTGGSYRFTHIDPDGERFEFRGVFHEAGPNDFIIQTFEYGGYPDVVSIETVRFIDLGNGCMRLIGHSTYPTRRHGRQRHGGRRGSGLRPAGQRARRAQSRHNFTLEEFNARPVTGGLWTEADRVTEAMHASSSRSGVLRSVPACQRPVLQRCDTRP